MKKALALMIGIAMFSSSVAMAVTVAPAGGVTAAGVQIYGDSTDATTASSTLIGKLSKGVILGAHFSPTAYAVNSKHDSGTTAYGTAYDSTAIYKTEIGSTVLAFPSALDNTSFSSWTSM